MTLKDVAKIAGVSPSTVSRVINSKSEKFASPEVQERVWEAVRQTGYIPNQQAKSLKEGRFHGAESATIYLLFARTASLDDNSYFSELGSCVEAEIMKQGYKLGAYYTSITASRINPADISVGKRDGLVILGKVQHDCSAFVSLFKKRVVYITLNQMDLGTDHIVCDGRLAAQTVMRYLYDCGHRHIAYVGELNREIRYKSYLEFMHGAKLRVERQHVISRPMTIQGGYSAAEELIGCEPQPTAVFCANDVTALGLLQGLREWGKAIPGDYSVASIDNIAQAARVAPGLTTAKIPLHEMGGWAVKTLTDRINKGHKTPVKMYIPLELVVRGSVAVLGAAKEQEEPRRT